MSMRIVRIGGGSFRNGHVFMFASLILMRKLKVYLN